MSSALIFISDFHGHRQLYAQAFCEILLGLGFEVAIAGPLDKTRQANEFPYLIPYFGNSKTRFIDTSNLERGGLFINNNQFRELQDRSGAELSVLLEADNHIALLTSQIGRSPFRGRLAGVFIRSTNYIYGRQTLRERLRRWKHLPSRWGQDEQLFHKYLMPRYHLLNVALALDENFVQNHQKTHVWMPDIFKSFWPSNVRTSNDRRKDTLSRLESFVLQNRNRPLVLYFGTAQPRRGYDILLRLALDEEACFAHCGLEDDNAAYQYDVVGLREKLRREGRILNLNAYIDDPVIIEAFFRAADKIILPYRGFLSSSGVMLQALDLGLPVLVSDVGLMASRVKTHNLGLTTKNGDYEDLRRTYRNFISLPRSRFDESIRNFMVQYSREKLVASINGALLKN